MIGRKFEIWRRASVQKADPGLSAADALTVPAAAAATAR